MIHLASTNITHISVLLPSSVMSQAEIDYFITRVSAVYDSLTSKGVVTAVASKRIPVNGRRCGGWSALHAAVHYQRRDLVVALLAAGANPNVKDDSGRTSVLEGAVWSTANILQLLIHGGSSVNEADDFGITPLIKLVRYNCGDVAARLQVLLACTELDLNAEYDGRTAEEWAVNTRCLQYAAAIEEERTRRTRWSVFRAVWIGVTATRLLAAS